MSYQRFVFLVAVISTFALLLAACTTTSDDDDVAEAADDPVAEVVEDDATDDEDAEATDDVAEEAVDDAVVEEDDEDVEEASDTVAAATDDAADDVGIGDDQFNALLAELGFESFDDVEAEPLNVETLEAEMLGRIFTATAYDNTYVGEVTDDLYVAISLDSTYGSDADGISAYVCDGKQIGFYVTGTLENGSASLDLAPDAALELTVADDDSISGTVTLEGQALQSFDTTAATGGAGLYVSTETVEDMEFETRWVVLEDGSQRGQICIGASLGPICLGLSANLGGSGGSAAQPGTLVEVSAPPGFHGN